MDGWADKPARGNMRKSSIEMPDMPDTWRDAEAATKPEVGEYYLPGVGRTYLNPEFAGKVAGLIQRAGDQGISLKFRITWWPASAPMTAVF